MSSTEPIDINIDDCYAAAKVKSKSPKLKKQSRFVQDEIDRMLEYVPEIDKIFEVLEKIGEGTFSQVYLAKLKNHPDSNHHFALKHIIPTSHPTRIESELRCLQEIGGCDNIMGVQLCIREKDHVVIVMPYFSHEKFQDYILQMDINEVQNYVRNLLIALRRLHEFDIIHRDVKPSNFLYNRDSKKFALVDFGLAQKAPVPLKAECDKKKIIIKSPIKRNTRRQFVENVPTPDSPSKKRRLDHSTAKTLAEVNINQDASLDSKPPRIHLDFRKNYTPPTPDISKLDFACRFKSPRRALLAKRVLLANEGKTLFTHTKASSSSGKQLRNGKTSKDLLMSSTCQCFGKPSVCRVCLARSPQSAPRAGTPGFRAPEVLMRCPDQTTAVDIWSAGVMFMSILSGHTPFFRAQDDMTALAQIIAIMGSDVMKTSALTYGKNLLCNPSVSALNIELMCEKLRESTLEMKSNTKKSPKRDNKKMKSCWPNAPKEAYDLLKCMLDVDPHTRITAEEALKHPFLAV